MLNFASLHRRSERALQIYKDYGFVNFLKKVTTQVRRGIGLLPAEEAAWRAQKGAVDRAFDEQLGVQTGGIEHLYSMSIDSENSRSGYSHIASDPERFMSTMNRLPFSLHDRSFIDLGSGRGRAVILATRFPFENIMGVEFAKELYISATENIEKLKPTDRARITLHHGDATKFQFPDGALLVYLFNPFDATICSACAQHLRAQWLTNERPISVMYENPRHLEAWTDHHWQIDFQDHGQVVMSPIR